MSLMLVLQHDGLAERDSHAAHVAPLQCKVPPPTPAKLASPITSLFETHSAAARVGEFDASDPRRVSHASAIMETLVSFLPKRCRAGGGAV